MEGIKMDWSKIKPGTKLVTNNVKEVWYIGPDPFIDRFVVVTFKQGVFYKEDLAVIDKDTLGVG